MLPHVPHRGCRAKLAHRQVWFQSKDLALIRRLRKRLPGGDSSCPLHSPVFRSDKVAMVRYGRLPSYCHLGTGVSSACSV